MSLLKQRFLRAFRRHLAGLAIVLSVALVIGMLTGYPLLAVLIALIAALAWQLFEQWRWGSALVGGDRAANSDRGIWRVLRDAQRQHRDTSTRRRKRLISALRAQRETVAALPDGVVALDGERRIVWFNAAAERLLQLDRDRDSRSRLTDLLRAPRIVEWLAADATEPLVDVASPADDQLRLLLWQIRGQNGQRLVVVRDISQLQRLEQMRRDFVANVSHELRTPLTVVHGYLDMIDPEDVPDYAPILRELRSQSRRMTEIVEDLLTLSRLDAQDRFAHDEVVALAPMLDTLRREANALSQGRHQITIERASNRDLRGSVKDLHSAFSNLVSNAVRYTPASGHIIIRWQADDSGGCLSVVDSGPGIPAHHLPRLAERFYRVSTSRSRETGGTGLGLSIAKHVLQLHDARLEISSEMGVGSRFACVFAPSRLLDPTTDAEEI